MAAPMVIERWQGGACGASAAMGLAQHLGIRVRCIGHTIDGGDVAGSNTCSEQFGACGERLRHSATFGWAGLRLWSRQLSTRLQQFCPRFPPQTLSSRPSASQQDRQWMDATVPALLCAQQIEGGPDITSIDTERLAEARKLSVTNKPHSFNLLVGNRSRPSHVNRSFGRLSWSATRPRSRSSGLSRRW